jgi:hypothetical protein
MTEWEDIEQKNEGIDEPIGSLLFPDQDVP